MQEDKDKKHELKPDDKAGGRVKALEAGEVLVEGYKMRGEGTMAGNLRASEEVFQQYSTEVSYILLSHTINRLHLLLHLDPVCSDSTQHSPSECATSDFHLLCP